MYGCLDVNTHTLEEPLAALTDHVNAHAAGGEVLFAPGYDEACADDAEAIAEAVRTATTADTAILFVGLPSIWVSIWALPLVMGMAERTRGEPVGREGTEEGKRGG